MDSERKPLTVSTSPHTKRSDSVLKIMLSVILTLVPALIYSILQFGLYVLVIYCVSIFTCLLSEYVVVRMRKKPFSLKDFSAVVTGILLAMTLPPRFPIYGVVLGAVVAVVIGKQIFGGLGYNIFNPALLGRAFLAATYPVQISKWTMPLLGADALSGATPLASMKFDGLGTPYSSLFLGTVNGSLGETSALLLLLGGAYLIARRYLKWQIPAAIFVTVAGLGQIAHLLNPAEYPDAIFHLFSGGLMLGALYMGTDIVTSPLTGKGCIIFGAGIGVLIVVMRLLGGLPEGVMYAILLMNAVVPLINRGTKPRIFGERPGHE